VEAPQGETLLLFLNEGAASVDFGVASAEFIGGGVHVDGAVVAPQAGRAVLVAAGMPAKTEAVTRGVMYVVKVAACTIGGFGRGSSTPTALAALPGACYAGSLLDPATAARLFAEAQALPFPRRNRGITRAEGAPRVAVYRVGPCGSLDQEGDPLPPPLPEAIRLLLDSGVLRKAPVQASVNYYDQPSYCMVPHKDGYAEQACILSLGSDACLHFWLEPMSESERLGRDLMATHHSGTAVYHECLARRPEQSVWMEAGSVLALEGEALSDYVHGLPCSPSDAVELSSDASAAMNPTAPPALANAQCIDLPALRQRAGVAGGTCAVPRQPRVSIVLWTEFVPPLLPAPEALNGGGGR